MSNDNRKPNGNNSQYSKNQSVSSINPQLYEISKLPPQAVELEEAVVGAVMLEKDAFGKVNFLKPEHFYKNAHRTIWEAVLDLQMHFMEVDILTVSKWLIDKKRIEEVGGAYYISQLTSRVASSANIEAHARIVYEKAIARELIVISTDCIKSAYDNGDVFDLIEKSSEELYKIYDSIHGVKKIETMAEIVLQEEKAYLDKMLKSKDGETIGVPSGFTDLDDITFGWQNTDLIILAARPAMGKTALAIQFAVNASKRKPVAVFSLEMNSVQLVQRLLLSESEVYSTNYKKGTLDHGQLDELQKTRNKLRELNIFLDDSAGISIFELDAKCRKLKQQHDIGLIVIDYLQLITTGDARLGNREQEIAFISRSLKGIAKKLNVPVIALAQLSRAVETRGGDKRPQLSDLRESGSIEADADIVSFLYRPEYYQIETDEEGNSTQGKAEFIIAKHRNGTLDTVELEFVNRLTKFLDPKRGVLSNNQSGVINDYKPTELKPNTNFYESNKEQKESDPF